MLLAVALAAAPILFDPLAFFAGRTEGVGHLRIVLHRARTVEVAGEGRPQPDGSLILNQTVAPAGRPVTTRQWRLRRVTPDRYAGTLSDAAGDVRVETNGARLHIAYRTRARIAVEQWLTLAPDGRSADNRLVARRFGVPVARLHETIRKLD